MLYPQDTLEAGQGTVHVEKAVAGRSSFKQLAFRYPLKLMPPRIAPNEAKLGPSLSCLYMLTYGGGLVAGDTIDLQVSVDAECHLMLLTQGNTKVFKDRVIGSGVNQPTPAGHPSSSQAASIPSGTITRQRMRVCIEPNASLFLLPAPVACFKDASYSQHQTFDLQDPSTSSLLLLDWFTSGRLARGENWHFNRYKSRNEVIVDGKTIIKDVLLLEGDGYQKRMARYTCYCNLFICGHALQSLSEHFKQLSKDEVQYQESESPEFIWSYSELEKDHAAVVRCAGLEPEAIKVWLTEKLQPLEDLVGKDVYKAAFA